VLAFSELHKDTLHGIEHADFDYFRSAQMDVCFRLPVAPYSCGKVAVRFERAFDISPEYLSEDRGGADVEYDFFRYGQMGTPPFQLIEALDGLEVYGTAWLCRSYRNGR
jgi:hypothetical protein